MGAGDVATIGLAHRIEGAEAPDFAAYDRS